MASEGSINAGRLSPWLSDFVRILESSGTSPVPCASCTACCRSAQFVHIEPDETATLSCVPSSLLFPAPGKPAGHMVLPYDQDGCCPMLGAGGCDIYEHRPRACRAYDCRVFAATGVVPDQPLIAERVRRWRFDLVDDGDRRAAEWFRTEAPQGVGAGSTRRALDAVHAYRDAHAVTHGRR